ncbi:MAG: dihydropteroate synthase [Chlorobium sp.]|nr:dihydropteroate synthase [Chlorobium phaeovibrioides]NQU46505.1 dihydropteroate synthase [Chlorobium sp.]
MTPFRPETRTIACQGRLLDFQQGPKIMGILNTTPDSFHDGGAFEKKPGNTDRTPGRIDLHAALNKALTMLREGADIIDIGGESSRPGATPVTAEEETRRTAPLISLLRRHSDAIISIDTCKAQVAEAALLAGADIVNDISGFTFDSDMAEVCARHKAPAILMHAPLKPEAMQWSTLTPTAKSDIVETVINFLHNAIQRAESAGVQSIIIDPGFGFGKSVEENFTLLQQLKEFRRTGRPILAGVSRKSFLGHAIKGKEESSPPTADRLNATIAAETIAILNGADIIRTHSVKAAAECRMVIQAMWKTEPSEKPHQAE